MRRKRKGRGLEARKGKEGTRQSRGIRRGESNGKGGMGKGDNGGGQGVKAGEGGEMEGGKKEGEAGGPAQKGPNKCKLNKSV